MKNSKAEEIDVALSLLTLINFIMPVPEEEQEIITKSHSKFMNYFYCLSALR